MNLSDLEFLICGDHTVEYIGLFDNKVYFNIIYSHVWCGLEAISFRSVLTAAQRILISIE